MPEAALHKRLQKPDGNLAAIATKSEREKRSPPPFVPFPPPSTQLGAHCAPCRGPAGVGGMLQARGWQGKEGTGEAAGEQGQTTVPSHGVICRSPPGGRQRGACTQAECLHSGEVPRREGEGGYLFAFTGSSNTPLFVVSPPHPRPELRGERPLLPPV